MSSKKFVFLSTTSSLFILLSHCRSMAEENFAYSYSMEEIVNDFFQQLICSECAVCGVIEDLKNPNKDASASLKDFLTIVLPSIFDSITDDLTFEDKLEHFISSDFSFALKSMVLSAEGLDKYFAGEMREVWSGQVPDGHGESMEVVVMTPSVLPVAVAHRDDLEIKLAGVRGNTTRWLTLCYCKKSRMHLCEDIWERFTHIKNSRANQALISTFRAFSGHEKQSIATFVSAIFNHEAEPKAFQDVQKHYNDMHDSHKIRPCAFKPEVIQSINEAMATQVPNPVAE